MRRTFLISSSVAVIKFTQQCETIYSRCDSPGKKKTERTKTSKLLFIGQIKFYAPFSTGNFLLQVLGAPWEHLIHITFFTLMVR